MYADGEVAQALRDAVELDRAATEALVARLLPGLELVTVEDGSLGQNRNPPDGFLYAGVFRGLTVICSPELAEIPPALLRPGWLAEGAGRRVILHSMHSVSDFLGFAVWAADGSLERALCLSPGQGIVEDRGDRLSFEQPYWAGEHPLDDEDEDDEPYPLLFHPLDLGEDVLAALCGFVLEGMPVREMPDVYRVPLAGFRLGAPTIELQRSPGRPIIQPSALDVASEVARLGNGLHHLILDRSRENYLQAAAGGRYNIPLGKFLVERREGSEDLHFRCEVDSIEEVAEIFEGYLLDQDGWGDRHWEQMWP
ncbi:hypothetical protein GCM10010168_89390 [Actinoplanes ianthinogenes]|uniref:Uncharacterized protein n=2 Tax=Actinoplanes ianthinogenes TaxID=122358 RepID=A0ABM7LPX9_9ACTN|nr:hypothetical protein Aiant_19580 [Actinoplanes ianthinogenes]GGR56542.1 hypothetical protein GCM10010168_89390 [Actinoplanes ianthinogenes]